MDQINGCRLRGKAGEVQDTGVWITRHLEGRELSSKELFAVMCQAGYVGAFLTVKRKLDAMVLTGLVKVARTRPILRERVFALPDIDADLPLERKKLAPLGIIPNRKLDPMAWIVFTSGCELEAA